MKKQSQFTQRTDVLDTDKMPGRRVGVPLNEANSEWSMAALKAYFGGLSAADLQQLQQDITAARSRANHTGTQLAATISDFTPTTTALIDAALAPIRALIGDEAGDANSFIDTVREVLTAFSQAPEGFDVLSALAGKQAALPADVLAALLAAVNPSGGNPLATLADLPTVPDALTAEQQARLKPYYAVNQNGEFFGFDALADLVAGSLQNPWQLAVLNQSAVLQLGQTLATATLEGNGATFGGEGVIQAGRIHNLSLFGASGQTQGLVLRNDGSTESLRVENAYVSCVYVEAGTAVRTSISQIGFAVQVAGILQLSAGSTLEFQPALVGAGQIIDERFGPGPAFTAIAENQAGTHPAFSDQHTLNLYLLANLGSGGGTAPPAEALTITNVFAS